MSILLHMTDETELCNAFWPHTLLGSDETFQAGRPHSPLAGPVTSPDGIVRVLFDGAVAVKEETLTRHKAGRVLVGEGTHGV